MNAPLGEVRVVTIDGVEIWQRRVAWFKPHWQHPFISQPGTGRVPVWVDEKPPDEPAVLT